jgi:hypothetical protein
LKTLKKLLPVVLETITGVARLLPSSEVATVVPIATATVATTAMATAATAIVAPTGQQTEVATVRIPTQQTKLQRSNHLAGATAIEDLIVLTIIRMPTMEALPLITSSTFVLATLVIRKQMQLPSAEATFLRETITPMKHF